MEKLGPKTNRSGAEPPSHEINPTQGAGPHDDRFERNPPPPPASFAPGPARAPSNIVVPESGLANLTRFNVFAADRDRIQTALDGLRSSEQFSVTSLARRSDLDQLLTDFLKLNDGHKGLNVSDLSYQVAEAKSLREQLEIRPGLIQLNSKRPLIHMLGDIRTVTGDSRFTQKALDKLLSHPQLSVEYLSTHARLAAHLLADLKIVRDAHDPNVSIAKLEARIEEARSIRAGKFRGLSASAAAADPVRETHYQNGAEVLRELQKETPSISRVVDLAQAGATLGARVPDIDRLGENRKSALQLAAESGKVDAVKTLLAAGANPNLVSNDLTPLVLAIIGDHPLAVSELLARGADPNRQDRHGMTPLHDAVRQGALWTVMTLLNHKANPTLTNARGQRPIDMTSDPDLQKLLKSAKP